MDNKQTEKKFEFAQLRALRNASEGVQRVSENLTKAVRKLASEIAELGEEGDIITLGDYWLEIQYHSSKLGGYNFLFVCKDGVGPEKALDYEGGYLHGDFNCFIAGAEREEIIFFSENVTEIIRKFVKKWEDQETRFTKALEKIKIFEEKEEISQ